MTDAEGSPVGTNEPPEPEVTPEPEKENAKPSPLATTLVEARRTLWKGNAPIFPGVMGVLRQYIFDPSLAIASVFWPAVLPGFVQPILATCFQWTCLPILRTIYSSTSCSSSDAKSSKTAMTGSAASSILRQPKVVVQIQPPSDFQSAFVGAISFGVSAITDLIGILTHPKTCQGWMESLSQFNSFLQSTGIGDELYEGIQKPLLRGRLLDNFKILNDIQEECHPDRIGPTVIKEKNEDLLSGDLKNGHKWMRFATAAYGAEMIKSAVDRDVAASSFDDPKQAIACHTQLRPEDVCFIYSGEDNHDMHVLHHYVALDHTEQAVILGIRGTLSLSGAVVDIQGMSVDYCAGKAHKGISQMATNIWKKSGEKIANLLDENSSYKLVVTGHSLGAGASCLLTVQIYVDELIKNRKIECYAFAPPPTYSPCGGDGGDQCAARLQKAMQSTVAYIHDNDVVPFLSITSVRRMAKFLDAVDNETEKIWFWRRWRIFYEYEGIPSNITDSVLTSEKVQHGDVDGECSMMIPAHRVVWCLAKKDGSFEAFACDAGKVAECDVFLCPDMLSDHLPEQYEDALDALIADTSKDEE